MSPINRGPGPLLGMRMAIPGMRPPPPPLHIFRARLPPSAMSPMRMPPPVGRMFPPMRQRMPPPHTPMPQRMPPPIRQRMPPPRPQRMPPPMQQRMPPPIRQRMPPPRPGTIMRPGGPLPMFGPRIGCGPPMPSPMMGPRGPRGPPLRPGPRGMPPHMLMRPRFPQGNNAIKSKGINAKKAIKLEVSARFPFFHLNFYFPNILHSNYFSVQ